jgi:hypothetical protein
MQGKQGKGLPDISRFSSMSARTHLRRIGGADWSLDLVDRYQGVHDFSNRGLLKFISQALMGVKQTRSPSEPNTAPV